jgi:uncharacterized Zn-binding protein involved in type VI secretion
MPLAARIGDTFTTGHGCSPVSTIATGAPTVIIEGKPAARIGDQSVVHTILIGKNCVPHVVPILTGSPTVIADGRPLARVGDTIDFGVITTGAPTVFAG